MGYLLAIVLASATGLPPREALDAMAIVMVLTCVASGIDYVVLFMGRAQHKIAAAEQA